MRILDKIGVMVIIGTLLGSCMVRPNEDCPYGLKEGKIVFGGAAETDGCGWLLEVEGVTYHPVNLDSVYQFPELPVLVSYTDDPEVFRCGRGGTVIPSVRITEIRKNAPDVRILKDDNWDNFPMDPFKLDTAFIEGDNLMMHVYYGGGCKEHELVLWKLPSGTVDNPPMELALSHDANEDMCDAWISKWLAFSLVPIRENGKRSVTFYLRGSPEMSAYYGKLTYRY